MFRTGHRTGPAPPAETTAEPTRIEPKVVESKAAETPTAPAAERSAARPMPMERPGTEAVLGKGVTFDGTLRFTGALRIDGTFKGQILAGDSLLIGEGADVAADITCGTIKVSGEARGSLTATRIAFPYVRTHRFLSPAESSFLAALRLAVHDQYDIFAKVRLLDLVSVRAEQGRQAAFNRVQSKHIDFLLCDRATSRPVLA